MTAIFESVQEDVDHFKVQDPNNIVGFAKVIEISTDEKSVEASKKLLDNLSDFLKNMPTDLFTEKQCEWGKQLILKMKDDINSIESFTENIHKLTEIDIVLDSTSVCKVLSNLAGSLELLYLCVDCLQAAIDTKTAVEQMKGIKPISFEELDKKYSTAA